MTTEKALAEGLENVFARCWPEIVDRAEDFRTRKNVARFIALMYARNPKRKMELMNFMTYFRKLAAKMTPNERLEIVGQNKTVQLHAAEITETFHAENVQRAFVNLMPEQADLLADILSRRRWGVVFSDRPAFVTSDRPVILHRGTCSKSSFGFATPGTMVFFPASPTRMIVIDDSWEYDFAHYKLTDSVAFNKIVASAARRFVYAAAESLDLADQIRGWVQSQKRNR